MIAASGGHYNTMHLLVKCFEKGYVIVVENQSTQPWQFTIISVLTCEAKPEMLVSES
jgi:hypothetical protein